MKLYFNIVILLCLTSVICVAQKEGGKLNPFRSFTLQVSQNQTTVVQFPYAVTGADRGVPNLLASKVPGIENVIKIKATQAFNDTTSLHIFTADGRVHTFSVSYNNFPQYTHYEWKQLSPYQIGQTSSTIFAGVPYNQLHLENLADSFRQKQPFLRTRSRKMKMQLWLQGIYYDSAVMIAKFRIGNRSALSFAAGFTQLYLSDRKKSKRTSSQQIPIPPYYYDQLPEIHGFNSKDWILIFPKTTVANNRKLQLIIHEKKGGRTMKLEIRNRHLLKAKPV